MNLIFRLFFVVISSNLLVICCPIINLACTQPIQHSNAFFSTIASKLKSAISPKLQGGLKLPHSWMIKYVFAFNFCTYFLYQLGIILIVYSFNVLPCKIENKIWKFSHNVGQNNYVYSYIFKFIFDCMKTLYS